MWSDEKCVYEALVWVFDHLTVNAGCLAFRSKLAGCELLRKILWNEEKPILHLQSGNNTSVFCKKAKTKKQFAHGYS